MHWEPGVQRRSDAAAGQEPSGSCVNSLSQPAALSSLRPAPPTACSRKVVFRFSPIEPGWRRAVTSPRTPHRAKESLRTAYVPVLLVKVALANVLLGLATGGPPSVGSLL